LLFLGFNNNYIGRVYLALEYDSIFLIFKEIGHVSSYNELFKLFKWFKDKDYLNIDILEITKYLIINECFEFNTDFNKFLMQSDDYRVKIRIFE